MKNMLPPRLPGSLYVGIPEMATWLFITSISGSFFKSLTLLCSIPLLAMSVIHILLVRLNFVYGVKASFIFVFHSSNLHTPQSLCTILSHAHPSNMARHPQDYKLVFLTQSCLFLNKYVLSFPYVPQNPLCSTSREITDLPSQGQQH